MRKILSLAGIAGLVLVFSAAPGSAAQKKAPVQLGQKVTNKGSKDVSKKSNATVEEELDDLYFEPTFIKAKAGQTITIKAENEGKQAHTFTSDTLGVDKELQPGKKATLTITVPTSGEAWQFHCQFHQSSGMVGAVYTTAGASLSGGSATSSSTNTSSSSGTSGASSSSSSSNITSNSSSNSSSSSGVPGY